MMVSCMFMPGRRERGRRCRRSARPAAPTHRSATHMRACAPHRTSKRIGQTMFHERSHRQRQIEKTNEQSDKAIGHLGERRPIKQQPVHFAHLSARSLLSHTTSNDVTLIYRLLTTVDVHWRRLHHLRQTSACKPQKKHCTTITKHFPYMDGPD